MGRLFIIGVALFTAAVLGHLLLTQVVHSRHYVRNGYLVAVVACVASLPLLAPLGALARVFVYLQFAILWNLYLVFFINLMNSVSLRMMIEIRQSSSGSMSLTQLQGVYSDGDALEARLHALMQNGFIREPGPQGFTLTPRGLILARVLAVSRWCFGIDRFG